MRSLKIVDFELKIVLSSTPLIYHMKTNILKSQIVLKVLFMQNTLKTIFFSNEHFSGN